MTQAINAAKLSILSSVVRKAVSGPHDVAPAVAAVDDEDDVEDEGVEVEFETELDELDSDELLLLVVDDEEDDVPSELGVVPSTLVEFADDVVSEDAMYCGVSVKKRESLENNRARSKVLTVRLGSNARGIPFRPIDLDALVRTGHVAIRIRTRRIVIHNADRLDIGREWALRVVRLAACPFDCSFGIIRITARPYAQLDAHRRLRIVGTVQRVGIRQRAHRGPINEPFELRFGPFERVVVEGRLR